MTLRLLALRRTVVNIVHVSNDLTGNDLTGGSLNIDGVPCWPVVFVWAWALRG
ncbi:unnamed protein product [Sphenostylis stenocarpa]|uniref:Uncharacterized protein n=1 Tax=Sphenostylis stenocarpa TaxID=92480 RepID=A0AA87BDA7_9FABA|nr:unnamed protein product [Sphenostylis stenocarpa]